MTTYKTKVLCDVEYFWEEGDKHSHDFFQIESFKVGKFDLMSGKYEYPALDEAVYNYLKENRDV